MNRLLRTTILPTKTSLSNRVNSLDFLSEPFEISITVNKEIFIDGIPLTVYENNLSQIKDVKQREEIRAEIENAIQITQKGGGPAGLVGAVGFLTSCTTITFVVLTTVHYAFTDPVNTVFHDLGQFKEWVTTDVCARQEASKGMFHAFHFLTPEEAAAENPYCKFKGSQYDIFIKLVNRGIIYNVFTAKQIYDLVIEGGGFLGGWALLSKMCTYTVGAVSAYLAVAGKRKSKKSKGKKNKKSRNR